MYHLHHCVMHHVGNNQAGADGSSTERYRRDSLAAFLRYWLRYALAAWLEVRAASVWLPRRVGLSVMRWASW